MKSSQKRIGIHRRDERTVFSVIMPAYNSSEHIAEAIDSMLNQTFQAFELIIVDDGSTDDTLSIVNEYAARDNRIRIIEQQNGGVGAARNTGIEAAQYDWIALFDSDDIAFTDRFEKQVKAITEDPELIVCSGAVQHMGYNGKILDDVKQVGPATKADFYEQRKQGQLIYIATTAAVFRKDIAQRIGGFDVRFRSAGDTEFWDRMADHGPMIGLTDPLVYYRMHGGGIMGTRYAELYRNTRYLEMRCKERAHGRDLSFDDFLQDYENQPLPQRILTHADRQSQFYYRNAGVALSKQERLKGFGYVMMATLFNPYLTVKRIGKRLTNKYFST